MIFTINQCSIDTDAYEVRRNGSLVPIEPQVFDLLVQLLENKDRVVTKDEIIERVWNGRVVSEAALSSRIKAVRQAIGDDGASQACIRTIRRRGFRVVAEVTRSAGPGDAGTPTDAAPADTTSDDTSSLRPPPNADRHQIKTTAALASEASGQRGHSTSARAGHSPEEGSSARAALASEASGQRGHSTSARAGHSPEEGSSARAALASEASGQRGHSTSARAGHSPEEGSSARAALASEASGQRGHSTSARAGHSLEEGSSARAALASEASGQRGHSTSALIALIVVVALGAAAGWYAFQPARHAAAPIAPAALGMPSGPGIAVLRFNNPSGDSTLNFLEGALTEEIVTKLTRFSELRVATRALTSEYDRNELDVKDVGRRLGVEFLVQGSLRRSEDRVRLTAQLIKAADGTLLWAESYERRLTPADLFAVQEDIASKVVAAVASISAGVIARQTLDKARGKPPRDLSAYECTIRTSEIMVAGFSAASHLAARTCLEAAIASEPDYAAAWAMLAWIHTLEFTQDMNKRPGSDGREQALVAARRAVELAPANSMARFAMARASYLMQDLDVFYAEAAQALKLNPHEPFLLGNLGNWLAFSGLWDAGVTMIRKAIALNPKVYPRWWHAALGKNHYRKGEFREALVEFKNMNLPNWWWNQVELAYTYGQLGDVENARAAVTKLLELYPGFDLEKAVLEHKKFSFEQSYIDLAVEGLRKAGVPERSPSQARL